MKVKKSALIYLAVTVMLFVSLGMDYRQRKAMEIDIRNSQGPPPSVGTPAPSFRVTTADGTVTNSEDLYGKRTVILFWSGNCPPSVSMLQHLSELLHTQDTDIAFIPVNTEDSPKQIRHIYSEKQIDAQVLTDHEKSGKWAYKARITPYVYILDEAAIVIRRQSGFSEAIVDSIATVLQSFPD